MLPSLERVIIRASSVLRTLTSSGKKNEALNANRDKNKKRQKERKRQEPLWSTRSSGANKNVSVSPTAVQAVSTALTFLIVESLDFASTKSMPRSGRTFLMVLQRSTPSGIVSKRSKGKLIFHIFSSLKEKKNEEENGEENENEKRKKK